ncbi:methyltransferase domain-containing protein [Candidatus Uhrbacteria bacterium]|nr:methyltransferase domain-containing protein [Candidatus Uhrbacteria bacterium]
MNHYQLEARYRDQGRYFRGVYDPKGLQAIQEWQATSSFSDLINYRFYQPKALTRYLLIADEFREALTSGTLLDVGSRDASAQQVIGRPCQLIDKNNLQLSSWDWEKEMIPYQDQSFDTVICLDTLEHINDFHRSFHDLLRVAKKYVIVSLPNCWRKVFKHMLMGYGMSGSYGLPPEKPMDRHKWFFNTEDIEAFLCYQSAVSVTPYRIAKMAYHMPMTIARHRIQYPLMRLLLPERHVKNLLTTVVCALLEKI